MSSPNGTDGDTQDVRYWLTEAGWDAANAAAAEEDEPA